MVLLLHFYCCKAICYMRQNCTLIILLFISASLSAQSVKIHGKITNTKMEPLAFVSVEVKELRTGTITKEDGTYELELDEGKYDLVISMIGYKSQIVTVITGKASIQKNIILEDDDSGTFRSSDQRERPI